jgi:hypothetical protein
LPGFTVAAGAANASLQPHHWHLHLQPLLLLLHLPLLLLLPLLLPLQLLHCQCRHQQQRTALPLQQRAQRLDPSAEGTAHSTLQQQLLQLLLLQQLLLVLRDTVKHMGCQQPAAAEDS